MSDLPFGELCESPLIPSTKKATAVPKAEKRTILVLLSPLCTKITPKTTPKSPANPTKLADTKAGSKLSKKSLGKERGCVILFPKRSVFAYLPVSVLLMMICSSFCKMHPA